ncbi:hypothetical protein [Bacillus sp. ISL-18]|nr:hypothetical protein [Bacillus sp. ISL-18]
MNKEFLDKVVLVTGAGSGTGKEIAAQINPVAILTLFQSVQ